jgi:hypothetical protein
MSFCRSSIHRNLEFGQQRNLRAVEISFALERLCASIFNDRRRDKSVEQGTAIQGEGRVDGS